MGAQVFVVKRGVCWAFGGVLGVGLWSWVFWECRGGVGGARDGCGVLVRREIAVVWVLLEGGGCRWVLEVNARVSEEVLGS